jgi:outer membrane protein assembly factor BamB
VNKIFYFFIIFILISECSLNKNSKFWTSTKNIQKENNIEYEEVFSNEGALKKELNTNLKIKLKNKNLRKISINNYNNTGQLNFDGDLKESISYRFSKIKNFNQLEPEISFYKDNVIFFDNKASILRFNNESDLIWKKNYYSKVEQKMGPVLELENNGKYIIVADNFSKYYMLDIFTGKQIWIKNNLAPFNSQIKIYKDKFFIIDFSNTLRCFSLKNGDELWNIKTENTLIKSQKKLSMVIIDEIVYFNNSIGDISAVEINKGELLWQLPTQSSLIYESAFSLETSDIITDKENLFLSNNKNQLFSINAATGTINWENKVNSNIRSIIIDEFIFTISIEGYLIILEKNSGNIIRVTDVFKNFRQKKIDDVSPTGFIIGLKNIYLSTDKGRLLVIDILSGKIKSTLKIDNDKISKPFIQGKNLFLIKDNAIIKLN